MRIALSTRGSLAFLASLLSLGACNSTLSTFECVDSSECVQGAVTGICTGARVCAFPDSDCDSGLRYGEAAGTRSRDCVEDAGAEAADASAGRIPIAVIYAEQPGCDKTTLRIGASTSETFDGATIESVEWSLFGPSGDLVDTLIDRPSAPISPGPIWQDGTPYEATLNLTPYMDRKGLQVSSNGETSSVFFQTTAPVTSGNYRFFGAVGREAVANPPGVEVLLEIDIRSTVPGTESTIVLRESVDVESPMTLFDFPVEVTSNNESLAVAFRLDPERRIWLDNVSLQPETGGNDKDGALLLQNRSFESGIEPWVAGDSNDPILSTLPIPDILLALGDYRLQLVVVDSNGLRSDVASKIIEHRLCE